MSIKKIVTWIIAALLLLALILFLYPYFTGNIWYSRFTLPTQTEIQECITSRASQILLSKLQDPNLLSITDDEEFIRLNRECSGRE